MGLSQPLSVAADGAGNIYIADRGNNAIKEWVAASNTVTTLVASGLSSPFGVAVDDGGNVYVTDSNNNAIKELPRAFLDPTAKLETPEAGNDVLPPVLPPRPTCFPHSRRPVTNHGRPSPVLPMAS